MHIIHMYICVWQGTGVEPVLKERDSVKFQHLVDVAGDIYTFLSTASQISCINLTYLYVMK